MTELTDFLFAWVPVFTIMIISITGFVCYQKVRSTQKIVEIKEAKKTKKSEETGGGGIIKLIDDAPNNIKQIDLEIQKITEGAHKTGMTPEQLKATLENLEHEKVLLGYATKYGSAVKPLAGSVGKLLEKVLGGLGN